MADRAIKGGSIIVGTDFSSASRRALAYAVRLARSEELKLKMVFVRSFFSTEMPEVEDAEDKHLIRQMLHQVVQSGINPRLAECVLVDGRPDREILNIAVHDHAAYIVVGTHGRRGFDRLMLGSVAESLLREADLPVIVVGPKVEENSESQLPWKRLLLATDLASGVSEAAQLAGALAVQKEAYLTIFNVQPDGTHAIPENQFDALESIMTRESWLRLKPQCLVRGGDLVTQVANMAKDCHADLLVMSAQAANRLLLHLHRGKIAEMLCVAPCPVMVLRRKDDPVSRGETPLLAETA